MWTGVWITGSQTYVFKFYSQVAEGGRFPYICTEGSLLRRGTKYEL